MTSGQPGSDSQAPSGHHPHFVGAGGAEGVARLVERFYFHMSNRPEAATIRALHPQDLTPVREVLTRYLTEWLGGPAAYSTEPLEAILVMLCERLTPDIPVRDPNASFAWREGKVVFDVHNGVQAQ